MQRWILASAALLVLLAGCLDANDDPEVVNMAKKAIKNNDPSVCGSLKLTSSQDSCYQQAAIGLKTDAACSMASKNGKDDCYYNVAVKTLSPGSCFGIADTDYKALCIAGVGGEAIETAYALANSTYARIIANL